MSRGWGVEQGAAREAASEFTRELGGDELLTLLERAALITEAILDLGLKMTRKAEAERTINSPDVAIPGNLGAGAIGDLGKELLVPAQGSEQLRGDFVFGFDVIGKGIGIADIWDFKAREEKFGP